MNKGIRMKNWFTASSIIKQFIGHLGATKKTGQLNTVVKFRHFVPSYLQGRKSSEHDGDLLDFTLTVPSTIFHQRRDVERIQYVVGTSFGPNGHSLLSR
jgi:hypothetical protein